MSHQYFMIRMPPNELAFLPTAALSPSLTSVNSNVIRRFPGPSSSLALFPHSRRVTRFCWLGYQHPSLPLPLLISGFRHSFFSYPYHYNSHLRDFVPLNHFPIAVRDLTMTTILPCLPIVLRTNAQVKGLSPGHEEHHSSLSISVSPCTPFMVTCSSHTKYHSVEHIAIVPRTCQMLNRCLLKESSGSRGNP